MGEAKSCRKPPRSRLLRLARGSGPGKVMKLTSEEADHYDGTSCLQRLQHPKMVQNSTAPSNLD